MIKRFFSPVPLPCVSLITVHGTLEAKRCVYLLLKTIHRHAGLMTCVSLITVHGTLEAKRCVYLLLKTIHRHAGLMTCVSLITVQGTLEAKRCAYLVLKTIHRHAGLMNEICSYHLEQDLSLGHVVFQKCFCQVASQPPIYENLTRF